MNGKKIGLGTVLAGSALALAFGVGAACSPKDVSQKSSEASVVTNDNGTVSRTFTECTVSTNGNLVTERRRETRTTLDADGNMLENSSSEYAQSYTVGDVGLTPLKTAAPAKGAAAAPASDSFLGLKFGAAFDGTNLVADADEPTLLQARFKPRKPLAGFDDYFVYVTPKTHKVAKVYACAKKAVDPQNGWRRHYLIEALEKRYQTWARPRSSFRPIYTFDIGSGRYVTTCLADATEDYGTLVVAWDEGVLGLAADETDALREEQRKAAAAKRQSRVNEAADAF